MVLLPPKRGHLALLVNHIKDNTCSAVSFDSVLSVKKPYYSSRSHSYPAQGLLTLPQTLSTEIDMLTLSVMHAWIVLFFFDGTYQVPYLIY